MTTARPVDAYADLLGGTRGLTPERVRARDAWVATLESVEKRDALFELEVLLKALACFANPRNHPGPRHGASIGARDFSAALMHARAALARAARLTRALAEGREPSPAARSTRYLETLLPEGDAPVPFAGDALAESTPERSLAVLRTGIENLIEVARGAGRLPHVPFRLFHSVLAVGRREVERSTFFNPLRALEFRAEHDRIEIPSLLEATPTVPGSHGPRLVALSFLSLFRMLRYLSLLEARAREPGGASSVVYLVMSVLRSDGRALTDHLLHRAGARLADDFDRDVFSVAASEIARHDESLAAAGRRLIEIRATLEGVAANLQLELRRAFERDFPAPDASPSHDEIVAAAASVSATLRPALQSAVLVLAATIGVSPRDARLFDGEDARRLLSERLRRDVWMFAQIVRAFSHKARVAPEAEVRWTGPSPLHFVREFLAYFRAMGYPLLRAADYPRFDAFLAAMNALDESDLMVSGLLDVAVAESELFAEFLTELFDQIGRRAELASRPFDRRAAAESLRAYLAGAASSTAVPPSTPAP